MSFLAITKSPKVEEKKVEKIGLGSQMLISPRTTLHRARPNVISKNSFKDQFGMFCFLFCLCVCLYVCCFVLFDLVLFGLDWFGLVF